MDENFASTEFFCMEEHAHAMSLKLLPLGRLASLHLQLEWNWSVQVGFHRPVCKRLRDRSQWNHAYDLNTIYIVFGTLSTNVWCRALDSCIRTGTNLCSVYKYNHMVIVLPDSYGHIPFLLHLVTADEKTLYVLLAKAK